MTVLYASVILLWIAAVVQGVQLWQTKRATRLLQHKVKALTGCHPDLFRDIPGPTVTSASAHFYLTDPTQTEG